MKEAHGSVVALCLFCTAGIGFGQAPSPRTASVGPDVVPIDIFETIHWGSGLDGAIQGYSSGTNACNIGDVPVLWHPFDNQHPVIGQNMFRLENGRFDQIGQSWLKWSFNSGNESFCGTCIDPGEYDLLGVQCSDAYTANFNGTQSRLGPKSIVNPFTGDFPQDHAFPDSGTDTDIAGRLQVHSADIDPALNTGALYFLEAQYVAADDSAAGNLYNNEAYRRVWIPDSSLDLSLSDPAGGSSVAVPMTPAIQAWQDQDPSVFLSFVDVPDDGRIYLARKVTDLGGGNWHYEIAIQNINSDRAIGGVIVRLPTGATAANLGFHFVEYHSGEIYDETPWTAAVTTVGVRWDTIDYATNPDANALRWGTLYNFWFDADVPAPSATLIELVLFKPGTPDSLEARIGPIPAKPGDTNCDGVVNFGDINPFVQALSDPAGYAGAHPGCPLSNADVNNDGAVNFADINAFVALLSG